MPENTLREIRAEAHLLQRIALGALVCYAVLATCALVAAFVLQLRATDALHQSRVAVANAARAEHQADRNAARLERVNRKTNIITEQRFALCRNSNQRHDATIRQLRSEEKGKAAAKQLRQEARLLHISPQNLRLLQKGSEHNSIAIINALAPKRDCSKIRRG